MVSLIDDGILVRRLEFDETSEVGERAAVMFGCGANSNLRHAITTEGNGARVLQGVMGPCRQEPNTNDLPTVTSRSEGR